MATFHESNFGRWSHTFDSDLDGFVATTPAEAKALRWEEALSDAMAAEIATSNIEQLDRVEARLAYFRETGDGF